MKLVLWFIKWVWHQDGNKRVGLGMMSDLYFLQEGIYLDKDNFHCFLTQRDHHGLIALTIEVSNMQYGEW